MTNVRIFFVFFLLGVSASNLFSQSEPEPNSHWLLISGGMNIPTSSFSNSTSFDITNGKGYKKSGAQFSISYCPMSKKQGLITTFFINSNGFDGKQYSTDNSISLPPSVAIGSEWKTLGLLTGYYRRFVFSGNESFAIDMKIQGGLLFGNSPVRELRFDFSPYQYDDRNSSESWSTGMMGLAGVGANYKLGKNYALRLGLDYTIGRIDHVVETSDHSVNASPFTNTTQNTVSILTSQYWGMNISLGFRINL